MTRRGGRSLTVHPYFNPHSPCGERLLSRLQLVWLGLFQSTLPLRGATPSRKRSTSTPSGFQSTLPLRGATEPQERSGQPQVISIHTPLAGSDCGGLYARHTECRHFNPHSPCGERPARRNCATRSYGNFNPHSPCGERPTDSNLLLSNYQISIHTPLAGSDDIVTTQVKKTIDITIKTHKSSNETKGLTTVRMVQVISIHTPLAGSDSRCRPCTKSTARYFNPHSPCGERLDQNANDVELTEISIHTPLAGSDTLETRPHPRALQISIHTPLAGSD